MNRNRYKHRYKLKILVYSTLNKHILNKVERNREREKIIAVKAVSMITKKRTI
jgi:hypothetical protein